MAIKHLDEYRDPVIAGKLAERIQAKSRRDIRLMEVCGTHTMSIYRSGIRSLLPKSIHLLSGPGCPVCVTAQGEIDAFVTLAAKKDTIITTFGDLIRVPGSGSSLQNEKAKGADIRIVYATFDALTIARENPDKRIVFLGVGFETTAPTVAAAIMTARQMGLDNFFVYSAHKIVPPALDVLMLSDKVNIDGFILPGHVSVIIGLDAYRPFFQRHLVPCAVAGFEPTDLLTGIALLVDQIEGGTPELANGYPRAVTNAGNSRAINVMDEVFRVVDATWRGIGTIPLSGLSIRDSYAAFDVCKNIDLPVEDVPEPKGCACGAILTGTKIPPQCPLYKTRCSPISPVGPCMVSSEGTCAAYYRYHENGDK
jgi:hydrogenase expression/formation protein HypD